MEFSPANAIVQRCIQSMRLRESGQTGEATRVMEQAWTQASDDFEKYLAAYFLAQCQQKPAEKLYWLEQALQFALLVNDPATNSALNTIYLQLAGCCAALNLEQAAEVHRNKAASISQAPADDGPFFHGSKAALKKGEELIAGKSSNYQEGLVMNHIYFTALPNGAGLAASLAQGDGAERVYLIEPTGAFEHDPNVTDKKFPGNPTRSYRTSFPLKVVAEVNDWNRQSEEQIKEWKQKLADSQGKIIN
ncbi:MAG: NAD(+)--rifampin ADP-ribosyltransferase [Bacteroidota bacterium]|nr:NAD(+)--rifampin ADP-ribosyltransferase [Bacteroidota bacterium]